MNEDADTLGALELALELAEGLLDGVELPPHAAMARAALAAIDIKTTVFFACCKIITSLIGATNPTRHGESRAEWLAPPRMTPLR